MGVWEEKGSTLAIRPEQWIGLLILDIIGIMVPLAALRGERIVITVTDPTFIQWNH